MNGRVSCSKYLITSILFVKKLSGFHNQEADMTLKCHRRSTQPLPFSLKDSVLIYRFSSPRVISQAC